jgi:hypothetical protein
MEMHMLRRFNFSLGSMLSVCLLLLERSDMIKIARVAGRMTGRAVGRLMLFRRQMDEILEQTAAKQVLCDSLKLRITSCETIAELGS